jgi:hypothetical protein
MRNESPTLWPYLLFALIVLAAGPARAACSSPTGNERDFRYNTDYHTYQFCNGTTWISLGVITGGGGGGTIPFGATSNGGSDDTGDANYMETSSATLLSGPGTIQSLSIYINTAAGHLRLGICDSTGTGGGPGALLATTNAFVPTTGWNTANVITPVALAAGTYWLAFLTDNNGLHIAYAASGTDDYYAFTYGAMPATYSTTPLNWAATYSIYATLAVGCLNPAGNEQQILYNTDYHTYQFCNGTTWISLGLNTGPTGAGYFVMSKTTYNGNLGGGLASPPAADALCLTDLTTNTGWMGYATANARAMVNAAHVHAFGVANQTSGHPNNLNASTQYLFADANNSGNGGASFTTNGSGMGPGDSADWSGASYFGADYKYWSNIGAGTATLWDGTTYANGDGSACDGYGNGGSGYNGPFGESKSGNTGSNRWENSVNLCNSTDHLICFVNPSNGGGAGCSNPAGAERDIQYNTDYHALQFCNGTTWMKFQ